jgi:chemotaxis signal transduction protein
MEVLVFRVGTTRCGVPAPAVVRLIQAVTVAPWPGAPPGFEGVIDYHGSIVAVLDIRHKLGLSPAPLRVTNEMVVFETGGCRLALRADQMESVQQLVPGPGGVARTEAGVVLVLDVDNLLDAQQRKAVSAAGGLQE